MARMDVELQWSRARYRFRASAPTRFIAQGEDLGALVVAGECKPETLRADMEHPLYLTLLTLYERNKLSPNRLRDTAAQFASVYGLLTVQSTPGAEEPLSDWGNAIRTARKLHKWTADFNTLGGGAFAELRAHAIRFGNFTVEISPRLSDRQPIMKIVPVNLLALMQMQWALLMTSRTTIKTCVACGQFFTAGGEGGRREDAIFCSRACNDRNKNEKKRLGSGKKAKQR